MGLFSPFLSGGVDYENDSVVVTFEAGSRFSTNASIPIIPDSVPEGDEQFRATFELPGGYRDLTKGDPEEAVITIENVITGWTQSVCVVEVVLWPTVDPLHILLYCMYTVIQIRRTLRTYCMYLHTYTVQLAWYLEGHAKFVLLVRTTRYQYCIS